MTIVVQKFGGTSVQSAELREIAAQHVRSAVESGHKVVAVVSAMGRSNDPYSTDTLLGLIDGNDAHVPKREQDLLQSCGEIISSVVFTNLLIGQGLKASALTGKQAGFVTNDTFGNARITEMKTDAILERFKESDVLVVAGFQGESTKGELTTLGRGGSDTSATALGAALNAKYVDIFTDVDGIMTADPRIVNDAKPLKTLTYSEVSNMAYQGAKVIHPRAVEIAMYAKIPLRIRSLQSDSTGTLITMSRDQLPGSDVEERLVTGITYVKDISQVTVQKAEDDHAAASLIFTKLAAEGISVDFINISRYEVVFTVPMHKEQHVQEAVKTLGYKANLLPRCAKVSAVGAGMTGVPGVVSKITTALHQEEIEILQATDSHTTIWVLVREDEMDLAVNALHHMFRLAEEQNS
ncbi:aspartate kinase [Geomicrobium sp. JCM 19055]|uniref:aspartate kinase n=1 Tax=Geomicrobium sp. JCM 19055 TaxID=1460649 RepID=UPI00045ECF28|nr:aspartate kinase [Geomicrobium sp. JCM 19055]GAK01548.1 aspartokinase [Geomicrobium sp. JCM 19055]